MDAAICDELPGRSKSALVLADTDDEGAIEILPAAPKTIVTSNTCALNVHLSLAAPVVLHPLRAMYRAPIGKVVQSMPQVLALTAVHPPMLRVVKPATIMCQ